MSAPTAGQMLATILRNALNADVRLLLEDPAGEQFVVVLDHMDRPEIVLGLADRNQDVAAVTLESGGVELLRDTLTGWLERQQ